MELQSLIVALATGTSCDWTGVEYLDRPWLDLETLSNGLISIIVQSKHFLNACLLQLGEGARGRGGRGGGGTPPNSGVYYSGNLFGAPDGQPDQRTLQALASKEGITTM